MLVVKAGEKDIQIVVPPSDRERVIVVRAVRPRSCRLGVQAELDIDVDRVPRGTLDRTHEPEEQTDAR